MPFFEKNALFLQRKTSILQRVKFARMVQNTDLEEDEL